MLILTVIIIGTIIFNFFKGQTHKINFKNCMCKIDIQHLSINNQTNSESTYDGFTYISNLNFINCKCVELTDISLVGKNYTSNDLKDNYVARTYLETSKKLKQFNCIFCYNSNLRITNLLVKNCGIGVYVTDNSTCAFFENIKFINTNKSVVNFNKRQIFCFAGNNSNVSVCTDSIYYKEHDVNITPLTAEDSAERISTKWNGVSVQTRKYRECNLPIILFANDIGSICNHNHTKLTIYDDVLNNYYSMKNINNFPYSIPIGAITFSYSLAGTTDIAKFNNNISTYNSLVISGNNTDYGINVGLKSGQYAIIPALSIDFNLDNTLYNNVLANVNATSVFNIYKFYWGGSITTSATFFNIPYTDMVVNKACVLTVKNYEYFLKLNQNNFKLVK